MKKLLGFVAAALTLIAALSLAPHPVVVKNAKAAQTVMCAPQSVENALGRQLGYSVGGGSIINVPSGSTYSLNGQGCAIVKAQDIPWFQNQGFSAGPPFGPNIIFTTGVATGTASFQIGLLPPNTYVQHILAINSTANAVTGGIGIGTTSGGSDVVAPANFACGANCNAFVADASLLKRILSTTATTPLFASANGASGAWNNANVTFTVVFGYF